jgi:hypothetical protein
MACYGANFTFVFLLQQILQDNSLTIHFWCQISLQAVYNEYDITAPTGLCLYAKFSNFCYSVVQGRHKTPVACKKLNVYLKYF